MIVYLNTVTTNKPHHSHGEHFHVHIVGVLLGHGDGHVHHQVHGIQGKLSIIAIISKDSNIF